MPLSIYEEYKLINRPDQSTPPWYFLPTSFTADLTQRDSARPAGAAPQAVSVPASIPRTPPQPSTQVRPAPPTATGTLVLRVL